MRTDQTIASLITLRERVLAKPDERTGKGGVN